VVEKRYSCCGSVGMRAGVYARRMGQPTQRATNYTARSNIEAARIFLHAQHISHSHSGIDEKRPTEKCAPSLQETSVRERGILNSRPDPQLRRITCRDRNGRLRSFWGKFTFYSKGQFNCRTISTPPGMGGEGNRRRGLIVGIDIYIYIYIYIYIDAHRTCRRPW